MDNRDDSRRRFLKVAAASAALITIPFPTMSIAQAAPTPSSSSIVTGTQIIDVSLRGSLYDQPKSMLLTPNAWSDAIELKGKGTFRVKVIPKEIDPRFGEVFTFILADATGKKLAQMNLGNSATGTFGAYGVQAYIVSIQKGS